MPENVQDVQSNIPKPAHYYFPAKLRKVYGLLLVVSVCVSVCLCHSYSEGCQFWNNDVLTGQWSFNDHILGIYRLYWGTLVPDDGFGDMTIY